MSPSVKYGLIGGVVFTMIIAAGCYILEQSVRNNTAVVYLKELVLIISVIAGVKGARDINKSAVLELKTGLKAGITTVVIICVFIFSFNMAYPFTLSENESAEVNEIGYAEYFKRMPVIDTSDIAFSKYTNTYDSAMKVGNIALASISIRKANIIHPNEETSKSKIKIVDHLMFLKSRELGFLFKSIFVTAIFPQIVMGLLISFVATMLFRFKQQSIL